MAMFEEGEDVGAFVMAEDGEEWFPFSLDNLEEMEAEQNSLARAMKQESADYGQTDSDNDADFTCRGTGASGPGPPDLRQVEDGAVGGARGGAGRGNASKRARSCESNSSRGTLIRGAGELRAGRDGRGGTGGGVGGARGGEGARSAVDVAKRACLVGIRESSVLPPNGRPEKNKGDRKEVRDATQEQRRIQQMVATELQAQAERTGNSSRACPSECKTKPHGAGVLASGVEGVSSRREPAPWPTPGGAGESGSGRGGRSRNKSSSSSSTTSTSLTSASCTTSDGRGGGRSGGSGGGGGDGAGKGSSVQNRRRLERNAREQKRSLKISQRIEDLRRMLSQFGVDVKTSKSAVLSEATDYIAHLQRQQAHAEAERARMLQLLHQANQRAAAAGAISAPLLAAGGASLGVAIPPATPTVASRCGVGELGGSVCDPAASNSSVATEGGTAASMTDAESKEDGSVSSGATTSAVSSTTVCPASDRVAEDTVKPPNRGMASANCSGTAAGTTSVIVKPEVKENPFSGSSDAAGALANDDASSPWDSHQKQPHLQQEQKQQQRQQQQQPKSAARESIQGTEACSTVGNVASTQTSEASTLPARLLSTRVQPTPTASSQIPSTRSGAGAMPPGLMLPGGAMQIRPDPVTGGAIQQMATAGGVSIGANLGVGFGMVGAPLEMATARALSHVNYERVFRTASVPMAIANLNGNLVDCNARLTEVTGFWREEALFMTIFDLVADPFLQHTLSMISSILSLRVVASPPFFQVLGKRRDGSPGGVVQIAVAQDEAFRPIHFSICILDCAAGGFVTGNS